MAWRFTKPPLDVCAVMRTVMSFAISDFTENRLQGSLPGNTFAPTTLSYFSVSTNRLTGTLPVPPGRSLALRTLLLQNNQFSGLFPAACLVYPMTIVIAFNNNFTGNFSHLVANVAQLNSGISVWYGQSLINDRA